MTGARGAGPPHADLELVDPASARARAVRRAFVDHVRAVLGDSTAGPDDPLDDGDPSLDADLALPDGAFWLAVAGGRDVGCVGVRALAGGPPSGAAPGAPSGEVEVKRMYVDPAARGAGLGRRLLARAEDWAAARGARRTVLDTSSALTAAGRLYRSAGYAEVAPYNANPHADLWFAKELPLRGAPPAPDQ